MDMQRPFLTDIDSRAQIKGSRDPLGLQAIWTRFGRHVVGNLTTVSTSVRDFTVLILGYHFIERAAEMDTDVSPLEIFLKWEQLAGYARGVVNNDWSFRGTERVKGNLNESTKVVLSADRGFQILANQKIYGLWGLYSGPARVSGLVETDPPRLSTSARELVDLIYLPALTKGGYKEGAAIQNLLHERVTRLDIEGRHRKLVEAVARLLRPKYHAREMEIYRDHLLYGGPRDSTQGRQRELAKVLGKTCDQRDFTFNAHTLRQLAREARGKRSEAEQLAFRLDRIRTCESLIAPASMLFAYLLGQDGQALDKVANRIRKHWGKSIGTIDQGAVEKLVDELNGPVADKAMSARWLKVSAALSEGDYREAMRLLVEQNGAVMHERGGSAPWVGVQRGNLKVRFQDEAASLPRCDDLPRLWRFPYFLDSLRAVAMVLRGASA